MTGLIRQDTKFVDKICLFKSALEIEVDDSVQLEHFVNDYTVCVEIMREEGNLDGGVEIFVTLEFLNE